MVSRRDEEHQHVVRGREQHGARGGEREQGVVLAAVELVLGEVAARERATRGRRRGDGGLEEEGGLVDHEPAVEGGLRRRGCRAARAPGRRRRRRSAAGPSASRGRPPPPWKASTIMRTMAPTARMRIGESSRRSVTSQSPWARRTARRGVGAEAGGGESPFGHAQHGLVEEPQVLRGACARVAQGLALLAVYTERKSATVGSMRDLK
jgi:hypothetical protein